MYEVNESGTSSSDTSSDFREGRNAVGMEVAHSEAAMLL